MGLVIDTSALIDVERATPESQEQAWSRRLGGLASEPVVLPPIVLAEMWAGAALANSTVRAAARRARVEAIALHVRLAEFDAETARVRGDLFAQLNRAGTIIPSNDLTVAATARRLDFGVLVGASGERHFRRIPNLRVEVLQLTTET